MNVNWEEYEKKGCMLVNVSNVTKYVLPQFRHYDEMFENIHYFTSFDKLKMVFSDVEELDKLSTEEVIERTREKHVQALFKLGFVRQGVHQIEIDDGHLVENGKCCVVCTRPTIYYCPDCHVSICNTIAEHNDKTCFEIMHSSEFLQQRLQGNDPDCGHIGTHQMAFYAIGQGYSGVRKDEKNCFVCHRTSKYYCSECQVTACNAWNGTSSATCFELVHTADHLKLKVKQRIERKKKKESLIEKGITQPQGAECDLVLMACGHHRGTYRTGQGYGGVNRNEKNCFACHLKTKYYCHECQVTACDVATGSNMASCFDLIHASSTLQQKIAQRFHRRKRKQKLTIGEFVDPMKQCLGCRNTTNTYCPICPGHQSLNLTAPKVLMPMVSPLPADTRTRAVRSRKQKQVWSPTISPKESGNETIVTSVLV